MMTFDFEEWQRIVANACPQRLYVTDNRQWFSGGTGIVYEWVKWA